MIIRGIIQSKVITQGSKNGKAWERCEFMINEKKYSTFKKEIFSQFNEGDIVEVELVKNGLYWNMESMKKMQPQASNEQNQPLTHHIPALSPLFEQDIITQLKRIADALEKK